MSDLNITPIIWYCLAALTFLYVVLKAVWNRLCFRGLVYFMVSKNYEIPSRDVLMKCIKEYVLNSIKK